MRSPLALLSEMAELFELKLSKNSQPGADTQHGRFQLKQLNSGNCQQGLKMGRVGQP